jgi:hypothetical protein
MWCRALIIVVAVLVLTGTMVDLQIQKTKRSQAASVSKQTSPDGAPKHKEDVGLAYFEHGQQL